MPLYHLAPAHAWRASVDAGTPYKPATYDADGGFVHLTADPAKLVAVGNAFYKHPPDAEWLLIELRDDCGDVRFEAAAPVGDTAPPDGFAGKRFPTCTSRSPTPPSWPRTPCSAATMGRFWEWRA